jgi:hypothetical protein
MLCLVSRMDDELLKKKTEMNKKQLISRMIDLEFKIVSWSLTNSQSNPGAMMDLRDMKRELEKIKTILGLK